MGTPEPRLNWADLPAQGRLQLRKSRILFVGEAVSLAHVGRPAMLAKWAEDAGYECAVACGERYANLVRDEGFEPLPLLTIPANTFYTRLKAGKFFYTSEELDSYVKAECELIGRWKPDLIVSDARFTLAVSARLCEVPLLTLNHAHWSPASPCPFSPPQTALFNAIPEVLLKPFWSMIRPIAFRVFAKELDLLRKRHGFPALNDFRRHYTDGDWCAYLDLPELAALPTLPERHFFLGPMSWSPRIRAGAELAILEQRGARPLVYVTPGSSGDKTVLAEILNGLLDAGCVGIVSGLSWAESQELKRQRPEFSESFVFPEQADPAHFLNRAAFTLCHGGAGTVYQSLGCGVPLLCTPSNPDQGLISGQVAAQGAGLICMPAKITAARISDMARRLISEASFSSRAEMLGLAIQSHDTRERWGNFLAQTLPARLRIPGSSLSSHETEATPFEVRTTV